MSSAQCSALCQTQLETLMQTLLLPAPERKTTSLPSLIIVAHGDDEALFAGDTLVQQQPWHMVCATCAERQGPEHAPSYYYYNKWREEEFRRCVVALLLTWGLPGASRSTASAGGPLYL